MRNKATSEKKERIAITITPSDLKVIELVKEKTGLSRNEAIARLLQLGIRQLNYFLDWQREFIGAKPVIPTSGQKG